MESANKRKVMIYAGAAVALVAAVGYTWIMSANKKKVATSASVAANIHTTSNKSQPVSFESLEQAGYKFNDEGKLIKIADGSEFKFIDQAHYDAIGDLVIEYIQDIMKTKFGLQQLRIPPSDSKWAPQTDIFVSPDWKTNPKMMVLLQGSGEVRPGVWGRSLCINKSLPAGSMLPYIERALKAGYSLVILNPNKNHERKGTERFRVEGSESPENHTLYVWDHFINNSEAKDVALVAHSYGGKCTVALIKARFEQVSEKLKAIAFTDSVHYFATDLSDEAKKAANFLQERAHNWITSDKPLNTALLESERTVVRSSQCPCFSAGTTDHPSTNNAAIDPVFSFFEQKLAH